MTVAQSTVDRKADHGTSYSFGFAPSAGTEIMRSCGAGTRSEDKKKELK